MLNLQFITVEPTIYCSTSTSFLQYLMAAKCKCKVQVGKLVRKARNSNRGCGWLQLGR